MTPYEEARERLLRPIICIENRTAQEAFDIMSDRIRSILSPEVGMGEEGEGSSRDHAPSDSIALEKVWVVLGSSGQWSDWSQWAVCVCEDEQTAKDKVGSLTSAVRVHYSIRPEHEYDDEGEQTNKDVTDAWLATQQNIDPRADAYDEPHYQPVEVPFLSSAKPPASESSRDEQNPLLRGGE